MTPEATEISGLSSYRSQLTSKKLQLTSGCWDFPGKRAWTSPMGLSSVEPQPSCGLWPNKTSGQAAWPWMDLVAQLWNRPVWLAGSGLIRPGTSLGGQKELGNDGEEAGRREHVIVYFLTAQCPLAGVLLTCQAWVLPHCLMAPKIPLPSPCQPPTSIIPQPSL